MSFMKAVYLVYQKQYVSKYIMHIYLYNLRNIWDIMYYVTYIIKITWENSNLS